jgi:hypothetical protein
MIDVAAHECGQREHLPSVGEAADIPLRAGKSALGILPGGAHDAEAVGVELKFTAQYRTGETPPIVKRGERHWHQTLVIAGTQGLGRPTGDRKIGVWINPLDFDHRTQAVVAANIIAAQKCAISGTAERGGYAPVRAKLKPAVGKHIAA